MVAKRIAAMQDTEFATDIKFICRHNIFKIKKHPHLMKNTGVDSTKTILSFHWHIALDAMGKHNHSFGAHDTGNLLHTAVEQLHEVLIVV